MGIHAVRGREALLALASNVSDTRGRTVLVVPGLDAGARVFDPFDPPPGLESKTLSGELRRRDIMAFHLSAVRGAGILALAFAGPSLVDQATGRGGSGSHIAYGPDGVRIEDVMSSGPRALRERVGVVHLVDAEGWEPLESANTPPGQPHLKYAYTGEGPVDVLGTGILTVEDIEPIRFEPDPANAHYQPA